MPHCIRYTDGMEDCIFCKIIAGEIPAAKVYEDESTFVILDRKPNSSGHSLVLPKKHFRNVFDVDAATFAAVMETARRMAPAIRTAVGADGMRIITNNERAGGQDVFHLHAHLIPFYAENPPVFEAREVANPEELAVTAEKIRAALA